MFKKCAIVFTFCLALIPSTHAQTPANSCPMHKWDSKKITRTVVGSWSSIQSIKCLIEVLRLTFNRNDMYHIHSYEYREKITADRYTLIHYVVDYLKTIFAPVIESSAYAGIAYLCLRNNEKEEESQNNA